MRIRGHVDYGAVKKAEPPPEPKPMGSSFTASAARKNLGGRARTKTRAPETDAVFAWLKDFVEKGLRAPTRDHVAKEFGNRGNDVVARLARDSRIRIEIWANNWRVIEIDGKRSMRSPNGTAPYKVIDGRTAAAQRGVP